VDAHDAHHECADTRDQQKYGPEQDDSLDDPIASDKGKCQTKAIALACASASRCLPLRGRRRLLLPL
jgi:hypothetical protein